MTMPPRRADGEAGASGPAKEMHVTTKGLRDAIVSAVNRVVARNGLSGTTLDAVAEEAGVSKGGLLYHFASKKELLLALIDRYESEFYDRRQALATKLPPGRRRNLKATVMVMLADLEATREKIPNSATLLDDEDLRARIGDFKRRLFTELSESVGSPGRVAMIQYLIDGLWMDVRFKPTVIPKEYRDEVAREVLKLVNSLENS